MREHHSSGNSSERCKFRVNEGIITINITRESHHSSEKFWDTKPQSQRRGTSAAQLMTQAQQGAQPQSPNSLRQFRVKEGAWAPLSSWCRPNKGHSHRVPTAYGSSFPRHGKAQTVLPLPWRTADSRDRSARLMTNLPSLLPSVNPRSSMTKMPRVLPPISLLKVR